MRLAKIVAGAAATAMVLSLFAGSTFAAVITIGTTGATLTCSVSCQAFSGAGGLDIDPAMPNTIDPTGAGILGSLAQLYNGEPANVADEGGRLSTLVGSSVGAGLKFDPPANPFDSAALYLVLKIGPHAIFVKNTSGGSQNYTYALNGATGLGLSHYTEFGTPAPIPVPGAIWLMGAGLAGLGFARRRNKAG